MMLNPWCIPIFFFILTAVFSVVFTADMCDAWHKKDCTPEQEKRMVTKAVISNFFLFLSLISAGLIVWKVNPINLTRNRKQIILAAIVVVIYCFIIAYLITQGPIHCERTSCDYSHWG